MRYTTQKSIGKIRWNTKSMQLIQRKEDKKKGTKTIRNQLYQ